MRAWRGHILAGLGLGVFTLLVGFPLVLEPMGLLVGPQSDGRNDLTAAFLAFRDFPRQVLSQEGQVPLWNPYFLGGTPWMGNPQSGLFYPPNWLFFMDAGPSLAGWLMLAHLWWGGVGVYALASQWDWHRLAGFFGGCAFLTAPYLMAHMGEGHYNQVCLVAWIPWAFWGYERLLNGDKRAVPLLAIVFALGFFCGHVQELYYLVLFLTLFVITDLCAPEPATQRKGLALSWLGLGLLTIGLVAVELLPQFAISRQAVRSGGLSLEQATAVSPGPSHFRQLLDPFAMGGPDNYSGPDHFFWETLFHFGWAASALAIVGFLSGLRNRVIWRYAALGLFATWIAFGANTPVYGWLFRIVPGFSLFHSPGRGLFFTSFAVAVLAAGGIDWLLKRERKKLAVAIALASLMLMAGESVRNSRRILAVVPLENVRQKSPLAEYLSEHAGFSRVLVHQDLLTEREAWRARIFKVHGYDPVPLTRTAIFFDALSPNQSLGKVVGLEPALPQRFDPALVELLGVKYAAVPVGSPLPKAGWKIIHSGEVPRDVTLTGQPVEMLGYQIFERASTFPRAFVLGQTRLLDSSVPFSKQLGTLSPRNELLMHQDVLPTGDRQTFEAAEILEYSPNRVVIDATLKFPGYLVLTDTYAPGWTATVDGARGTILPVNVAFRGVPLSAGTHRVELNYSPPGWRIGLAVSVLSVLIWVALVVRGFTKHETPYGGTP